MVGPVLSRYENGPGVVTEAGEVRKVRSVTAGTAGLLRRLLFGGRAVPGPLLAGAVGIAAYQLALLPLPATKAGPAGLPAGRTESAARRAMGP